MRVCWAMHRAVIFDSHAVGYTSSSVALLAALRASGRVEIVDDAQDADVVVHYCHPRNFVPVDGKRNVLFTMYELDPPPPEFAAASRVADAVLTPSAYSARLLRMGMNRETPLVVVPLGFDPSVWTLPTGPRAWDSAEPFTFLYVGALNDRKGTHLIMRAFERFDGVPGVRLVMKISGTGDATRRRVVERNGVIYDDRALPAEALRVLYRRAHAFVFPTLGEGFGLTPLEAAAVGLPLIVSAGGAIGEFLDQRLVAAALPTRRHALQVGDDESVKYGWRVDPDALSAAMLDVVRNYRPAARNALRLARRVHEGWTYAHAADRLALALTRLAEDRRWLPRRAA